MNKSYAGQNQRKRIASERWQGSIKRNNIAKKRKKMKRRRKRGKRGKRMRKQRARLRRNFRNTRKRVVFDKN